MRLNAAKAIGLGLSLGLFEMSTAWATNVAPGCVAPNVGSGHASFYVDPIHGSMAGDGSKAHPWHTLSEVFDVQRGLVANASPTFIAGLGYVKPHTDAPIKSGDTIYLMSGNHGDVFLQGNFGTNSLLYGYDNAEFVTIAAAAGQTPIIKQLTLKGVNKWIFQGITFESLQDVPANGGQPFTNKIPGTVDYYLVGMNGPNSNVVFENDIFQSQADTSKWTVEDWLRKRVSGIVAIGGRCLSITQNRFQNIGFAIGSQRGSNILIQQNVINRFTDDGIDFGSDNMVIDHNQITNSIDDGDGFHQDAMQGQPYGSIPVSEVHITNNYVVNQTEKLVAPASLQGIDTFDGVWNRVRILNNVVVTNAYHGITFYGVNDIWVVNNTVIASGGPNTWININPSKSGAASQKASIRNNLATFFAINATPAFVDHNMLVTTNPNALKYFQSSSAVATAMDPSNVFAGFNPTSFQYDMRLRQSPAVAAGGRAVAPSVDIRGLSRAKAIDLGAFAFGGPPLSLQPH